MKLPKGLGSDQNKLANTRNLTRIITFLSEKDYPLIQRDIIKATGVVKIADALNWLVCNKIILKEHIPITRGKNSSYSTGSYRVNPEFLNLRGEKCLLV